MPERVRFDGMVDELIEFDIEKVAPSMIMVALFKFREALVLAQMVIHFHSAV